ncbi:MAG: hypothetical protein QM844_06455, partial [Planctomycetota bacterium]|nr:hypothetical protein [Planctomycetota bacterium]
ACFVLSSKYLFRLTREEHFFELQCRLDSFLDLLFKVAWKKDNGINVVRLLLRSNETAIRQETLCTDLSRRLNPAPKSKGQSASSAT